MQTNYNEVAVLQQGAGKVTGARKLVKIVNIHMRDIETSGKMKRLKRKMEVQKITFNYFARPQPRNWNFFYATMMMAIQKNIVRFQNLLWVYGMAWMRVRFPGLKFCPSPPLSVWLQGYIYLLQFEDEPAAARWGSADLSPSGVCLFLESIALNSTSNAVTSKWPCRSPCGWAWELPSLIHYGLNASLDQESNPEHHTHLNMQMRTCSAVFQIAFVISA